MSSGHKEDEEDVVNSLLRDAGIDFVNVDDETDLGRKVPALRSGPGKLFQGGLDGVLESYRDSEIDDEVDDESLIRSAASEARIEAEAAIAPTMNSLKKCRTSLLRRKMRRRNRSLRKQRENEQGGESAGGDGNVWEDAEQLDPGKVVVGGNNGEETLEQRKEAFNAVLEQLKQRRRRVHATARSHRSGRRTERSHHHGVAPASARSTSSMFGTPPLTFRFSSALRDTARRIRDVTTGYERGVELEDERDAGAGVSPTSADSSYVSDDEEEEFGEEKNGDFVGEAVSGCASRMRPCVERWDPLAKLLKDNVTETRWFSALIMFFIVAAGLNTGIQTYSGSLDEDVVVVLGVIDVAVLYVFVAEAVLKIAAEGSKPHHYFYDPWNRFDFVIVVLSFLPISIRSLLRLIRLLRVLKVVRFIKGLRLLVLSLLRSMKSLGYVGLLVLLVFYLYAVTGVIVFRQNDPANFNSLPIALVTLIRTSLGDDHMDIVWTGIFGCDQYGYVPQTIETNTTNGTIETREALVSVDGFPAECTDPTPNPVLTVLYHLSFVMLASFVLVNVIVSLVVSSVAEIRAEEGRGTKVTIEVLSAKNLPAADVLGTSDPYVKLSIGSSSQKSAVRKRTLNPRWTGQVFEYHPLEDLGTDLKVQIFDWDRFSEDDLLGFANIPLDRLPANQPMLAKITLSIPDDVMQQERERFEARGMSVPEASLVLKLTKEIKVGDVASDTAKMDPEDRLSFFTRRSELMWDEVRWDLSSIVRGRSKLREVVARRVQRARDGLLRMAEAIAATASKTSDKFDQNPENIDTGAGVTPSASSALSTKSAAAPSSPTIDDPEARMRLAAALGTLADSLGLPVQGLGGRGITFKGHLRQAPLRPGEERDPTEERPSRRVFTLDRITPGGWVRANAGGTSFRWFRIREDLQEDHELLRSVLESKDPSSALEGDLSWFDVHANAILRTAKRSGSMRDLRSASPSQNEQQRLRSSSDGEPSSAKQQQRNLEWFVAGEAQVHGLQRTHSIPGLLLGGVDEGDEEEDDEEEDDVDEKQ